MSDRELDAELIQDALYEIKSDHNWAHDVLEQAINGSSWSINRLAKALYELEPYTRGIGPDLTWGDLLEEDRESYRVSADKFIKMMGWVA